MNNTRATRCRPLEGVPHMAKKMFLTGTFKREGIRPITRTTDKAYPFAWMAFGHDKNGKQFAIAGFSGSRALAEKAATTSMNYYSHNPRGIEVVEVVATEPVKKVNPAKGKPWRIVSSYGSNARFVSGDRGEHLRYATRAEADTVAEQMTADSLAKHQRSPGFVACSYAPYKGPLKS